MFTLGKFWYIELKNSRSLIGKSPSTLRRWEAEGKIKPQRSKGNQRYYTDKDLHIALNIESTKGNSKFIVYCRVSSRGQATELKHQVMAMEEFCRGRGLAVDEWIMD